ncbi:MAG TPA: M56 family metallopeptidase [Flavobacterium sp.]|nr:M56 family metallopeptidase [Flavobacterium sp.]
MESIMLYLIKSSGLIGLFFLAYYFLLRKETFFNSNRWFLLAGLITSILLPLFFITKIIWVEPTTNTFDWSNVAVTTSVTNQEPEINCYEIAGYVYFTGIAITFLKLILDFKSLFKILKEKAIQKNGNFKMIDVTENIAPFSFFKYIVYNSSLYNTTELENILEHEKVHSYQKHSLDVLISRLFCVFFWFNPLIWFYKKAIAQNLEFIADSEASKNIIDTKSYQLTLLKITTQENCVAITNHFYQSLIKKRIIMLNKNQSKKWNSWKYAAIIPSLVAFVFLFQIEVVAQEKKMQAQNNDQKLEYRESFTINKRTTDETINSEIKKIKNEYQTDVIISKIERNLKGEIIAIKIEIKSPNKETTTYQSSDNKAIKPILVLIAKKKDSDEIVGFSVLSESITKNKKQQSTSGLYEIPAPPPPTVEAPAPPPPPVVKEPTKKTTSQLLNSLPETSKPENNETKTYKSNTLAQIDDDTEYFINGTKVNKSGFEKLDQSKIKSINVVKGKSKTISIATLDNEKPEKVSVVGYAKSIQIPDNTELFIDGNKVDKSEVKKIDQSKISKIDVTKGETNTITNTTKK